MIEIQNIEKKFGDNHVLKNVSFTFEKGKTNLIIGESGSGKTILIKMFYLYFAYPSNPGLQQWRGNLLPKRQISPT